MHEWPNYASQQLIKRKLCYESGETTRGQSVSNKQHAETRLTNVNENKPREQRDWTELDRPVSESCREIAWE